MDTILADTTLSGQQNSMDTILADTTGSGRRLAFIMFANGFTVSNRIITDYMESVVREIIENC